MTQLLDYEDKSEREFLFMILLQGWPWKVFTDLVNDMLATIIP